MGPLGQQNWGHFVNGRNKIETKLSFKIIYLYLLLSKICMFQFVNRTNYSFTCVLNKFSSRYLFIRNNASLMCFRNKVPNIQNTEFDLNGVLFNAANVVSSVSFIWAFYASGYGTICLNTIKLFHYKLQYYLQFATQSTWYQNRFWNQTAHIICFLWLTKQQVFVYTMDLFTIASLCVMPKVRLRELILFKNES